MPRRRKINQIFDPVLTVDVTKTDKDKLVYLLVANRPVKYGNDYSRILYIGTTKRGLKRISGSASKRVQQAYEDPNLRGIKRIEAYVVWTASPRRGADAFQGRHAWYVLETALLLKFKEKFGEQPKLNKQGKNFGDRQRYVFELFAEKAVERIVNRYM